MKFLSFSERITGKLLCVELESITIILSTTERELHLEDYGVKEDDDYLEQFDNTTEFTVISTTAGTIHVRENIHQVLAKIIQALDKRICPRCKNGDIDETYNFCTICGFDLRPMRSL